MYLYDGNITAARNHKYTNSSLNLVIMKVQNLIFLHFQCSKCRVKANNNRQAVVVCARHVMKLGYGHLGTWTIWYGPFGADDSVQGQFTTGQFGTWTVTLYILKYLLKTSIGMESR